MNKVNYLFCINTGRSGSHYLSSIFDNVENCISEHEMKPIGHSTEMRQFLSGNREPMKNLSEKRLELIKQKCLNGETFIETSHLFIKGFGWFFAENIPHEEIGVIILERDKDKVVSSLERIDCVALEQRGQNWIKTPAMRNPIMKAPSLFFLSPKMSFSLMHFLSNAIKKKIYQFKKIGISRLPYPKFFRLYNRKCLEWYFDETFAQGESFQKKFPNIRYYKVNIENLNKADKVQELLDYFGLKLNADMTSIIGKPTNLKSKH